MTSAAPRVRSVALRLLVAFILGSAVLPHPVRAQEGTFAFQIRSGIGLPLGSFRGGTESWTGKGRAGPSLEMGFTFPGPGPFGMFLGFGQRRFGCTGGLCAKGADWISTGFDVALRLVVGRHRIRPWLRGGLHTHRVEGKISDIEGMDSLEVQSEGGAGYELAGGLLIAVGQRTSLSPGIRYGRGNVPFTGMSDLHLEYLVADLGLVLGF